MRTTLINTTFWREDAIDELHLDSKLLYLYMLTNPDKGLANIYHYKPKVIAAYAGLSTEQIEVSIKQLISLGYVDVFNGFYVLLKGHEMPKKGRFTEQTMEKEKELIPLDVLEHFNLLILQSSSGVAPEHKDNNKTNNKDKDITIKEDKSKPDINLMFDTWHLVVGYKIESNRQKNRYACSNLLKKYSVEELTRLIEGVALSQSDQFAPRVSDFVSLQAKLTELFAWGKRTNSKKITVGEI